jgi:hypothetical protein
MQQVFVGSRSGVIAHSLRLKAQSQRYSTITSWSMKMSQLTFRSSFQRVNGPVDPGDEYEWKDTEYEADLPDDPPELELPDPEDPYDWEEDDISF